MSPYDQYQVFKNRTYSGPFTIRRDGLVGIRLAYAGLVHQYDEPAKYSNVAQRSRPASCMVF